MKGYWSQNLKFGSVYIVCIIGMHSGNSQKEGLWLWLLVSVTYDRWHMTHDMWLVTCDVTHDTWHVTPDTWHLAHEICLCIGATIPTRPERFSVSHLRDLFITSAMEDLIFSFSCILFIPITYVQLEDIN